MKHWNNPKIIGGLREGNYRVTRAAVNALQETPWRLNQKILATMREAETSGKVSMEIEELEDFTFKLKVCGDIGDHERFYYPYQLDFRGRAYCLPPLVNPQGDDVGRALVEFADGKPLGRDGVRWLQIHLANVYGECKGTMGERIDWVLENSAKIRESAANPMKNQWWTRASKKWRFLAAAFDWENHLLNGPEAVSYLPVLVDGTCNGFQHFSALLRNTEGAIATNLMPGERPGDFYAKVADLLRDALEAETESTRRRLADEWLAKVEIDRELVKSAVMKTPYGITEWAIRKELFDEFFENLRISWDSCDYLAGELKRCVRNAFKEADEASDWLKDIARFFAKPPSPLAIQGVHWTAPSGFRVIQERWKYKSKRLTIGGRELVVYDLTKPQELGVKEQAQSIVPNFIHSLDAAHLMLTIAHLANPPAPPPGQPRPEKLGHFAVVHDAYGVHACDVDRLREVLKIEFVKMHREPVLHRFAAEQREAAGGIELPPPPPMGDFDIEQVLQSEYFFC